MDSVDGYSYRDLLPKRLEPKKALVSKIPNINHIAVVLLIEIGDFSILLGSDLEETKEPRTGWAAIVSSTTRPQGKAAIFKIPHHGSETAHSEDVWNKMLEKNPLALCTPYNRKVILPGKSDVQRIYRYTDNAHITSTIKERKLASKSDSTVEKTIRESGINFRSSTFTTGHVRCRYNGTVLSVDHFNGAAPLRNHTA